MSPRPKTRTSGNSNRPLAEAISQYLDVPLTQATIRRFADMEVFVEILENVRGEDVFIKELIPHVDKTERTIANRSGRALEGFSQGGRGTTRIMFKHPELFCSAAPGGAGHATEKKISENDGRENENLKFSTGDNTWDLARAYAADPQPPIKILVHVGTE